MAILKLNIDDIEENEFSLLAIHTSLEDYRLAYLINQKLSIKLEKSKKEFIMENKQGDTHFSRFEFEDKKKDIIWTLFQNKNEISLKNVTTAFNLFSTNNLSDYTTTFLLTEFKKTDFFLKIDNGDELFDTELINTTVNSINKVGMAYWVDVQKIKNKNNLIF